MRTSTRLMIFGTGLAAAFAAALGVGGLVDPVVADPPPAHEDGGHESEEVAHGDDGHAHGVGEQAAGLAVSADGYTLDLATYELLPGDGVELAFRVLGSSGAVVDAYDVSHEKTMHLIVVRRDLAGFQHVHPVLTDGTWRVPLDLDPGQWRVFADFVPSASGEGVTLGSDLVVPGELDPVPLPGEQTTATVDGYEVSLEGVLRAGVETPLTLSITRDGEPVTDLGPYLGAYGHLVVLRAGDLGYLHVHPEGHPGDGQTEAGPEITFTTTAPSPGTYRLYLDFQHEGTVRTAELTVRVAS